MDLIKESKGIHKCLLTRWNELGLKNAHIIKDAEERGMILTKSQMSNYRKEENFSGLTQVQVLWLCFRYGIKILLTIGEPMIKKGKIVYEISAYNELECINNLKKHQELFK